MTIQNIQIRPYLIILCFFLTATALVAQIPNKYGLKVISKYSDYRESVKTDSSKALIDLQKSIPGIRLDIRYASKNNFLKEAVYKTPAAFARKPVAEALKLIQAELKVQGLGLKIFDAYRPYAVTVYFFEKVRDTNFVAVPWRGSLHNRGCAVDLTIISLKDGKEIPMPTEYDDFTDKAYPTYKDLPADILKNRSLLIHTMGKHGFTVYPAEWWHFDYHGWEKFEIMDVPFEELLK